MRAAPRAASGSPPETPVLGTGLSRLPAARRLRSPAQFLAVTSDPRALRASRRWLAIAGRVTIGGAREVPVRFGFTAARRHGRRAVDRNAVKRVLREAARRRIEELDVAAGNCAVDIVLRLRAAPSRTLSLSDWKATLRDEADALLGELTGRLRLAREQA